MLNLAKLLAVSLPPPDDQVWLTAAEEGVDYLVGHLGENETILFTNVGQSYVVSVFAPSVQVTPTDQGDLLRAMIMPESTWSMTYSVRGDTFDYYLSPPLDSPGCNSLVGGEMPVIRRYFESVDRGPKRTEVNQKLVHALELYWLDEQQAFCRLDGNGDVEPVIRVTDMSKHSGAESDVLVTIKSRDLARYLAVTDAALVQKFDFTRFFSSGQLHSLEPARRNQISWKRSVLQHDQPIWCELRERHNRQPHRSHSRGTGERSQGRVAQCG